MPDFEKYQATKDALGIPSQAMEAMKDQLIMVLVQRLGGVVEVPVSEIDATGDKFMMMEIDPVNRDFTFTVRAKSLVTEPMPIRPENKDRYPDNWDEISLAKREAAGNRCEGSPAYPDCRAANGEPHPVTGSIVVLTVGHLNHTPEDCRDANLKVWCQRCHLTYDAKHHAETARQTRMRRKACGDLFEGEYA